MNDSPGLFVKSYFASSIESAMEQAHTELGPDALLLNSREAPPEARYQGVYEVVFGCRPAASATPTTSDPVDDLRKRMDELREMVARIGMAGNSRSAALVADALIEAGVEASLAVQVEQAVEHRLRNQSVIQMGRPRPAGGWDAAAVMRETAAELTSRFEVSAAVGHAVALVGPPGSGKTTCAIKLAITEGLTRRRPVRLVSADNVRIGSALQLQTYAELLGVPFTVVETAGALAHAIDSAPAEALVLIDTAGYTGTPDELGLAATLGARQDIDTHLVLTASMRLADLRRTIDRFAGFKPGRLLFTRLDETDSTAAIFSEAARTGKPLSFLSTGQLVPEDWEAATQERVVRSLVRQLPLPCEAVA